MSFALFRGYFKDAQYVHSPALTLYCLYKQKAWKEHPSSYLCGGGDQNRNFGKFLDFNRNLLKM